MSLLTLMVIALVGTHLRMLVSMMPVLTAHLQPPGGEEPDDTQSE